MATVHLLEDNPKQARTRSGRVSRGTFAADRPPQHRRGREGWPPRVVPSDRRRGTPAPPSASPCGARRTPGCSPARPVGPTACTRPDPCTSRLLRSPMAHARLTRVDVSAARGCPVLSRPTPAPTSPTTWRPADGLDGSEDTKTPSHFRWPQDKVRYVGVAVAVVVATSRYAAVDGAGGGGGRLRAAARVLDMELAMSDGSRSSTTTSTRTSASPHPRGARRLRGHPRRTPTSSCAPLHQPAADPQRDGAPRRWSPTRRPELLVPASGRRPRFLTSCGSSCRS